MKGRVLLIIVIVFVVLVAFIGAGVILNYNSIVKAEKWVDEAKAQIEVVCQRRLDLIPNLVETVRGYAKHEQETLLAVTQARSDAQIILDKISGKKSLSREDLNLFMKSQYGLTSSLKNLLALVENYPDLKASSNFMALQDQIEGTENRIAVSRQRYNSAARLYNTKITTFPGVAVASMFGFQEKDYFEATEKAEVSPNVKF